MHEVKEDIKNINNTLNYLVLVKNYGKKIFDFGRSQ